MTTLAAALGGVDARCWWPGPSTGHAPVVLVTRSDARGLQAAYTAARQWASGQVGPRVRLLGLVIVQDVPGRLPKPLRELADMVAGGVPRVWHVPFLEQLRLGAPAVQVAGHPDLVALAAELKALTPTGTDPSADGLADGAAAPVPPAAAATGAATGVATGVTAAAAATAVFPVVTGQGSSLPDREDGADGAHGAHAADGADGDGDGDGYDDAAHVD